MIAGNPKAGRTVAAFAVALVLLIFVSTAFIAMRKRMPPMRVVPLHPSTFVLSAHASTDDPETAGFPSHHQKAI